MKTKKRKGFRFLSMNFNGLKLLTIFCNIKFDYCLPFVVAYASFLLLSSWVLDKMENKCYSERISRKKNRNNLVVSSWLINSARFTSFEFDIGKITITKWQQKKKTDEEVKLFSILLKYFLKIFFFFSKTTWILFSCNIGDKESYQGKIFFFCRH